MKQARASPTYYSPSGCTESILAEAARAPGVTALSLARSAAALRESFPLSASETWWWGSAGKPSHMCLAAPGLGSTGEHKAAAVIKFPWSLPNLWDQWGEAIRDPMPLPAASLCHWSLVWLWANLLPPNLHLPHVSLFPSSTVDISTGWSLYIAELAAHVQQGSRWAWV